MRIHHRHPTNECSRRRPSRRGGLFSSVQLNDLCRLVVYKALDMVRPFIQRGAFLICELMSLIDSNDTSKRAADVVQNLFDDRQADAESSHAACSGTS